MGLQCGLVEPIAALSQTGGHFFALEAVVDRDHVLARRGDQLVHEGLVLEREPRNLDGPAAQHVGMVGAGEGAAGGDGKVVERAHLPVHCRQVFWSQWLCCLASVWVDKGSI